MMSVMLSAVTDPPSMIRRRHRESAPDRAGKPGAVLDRVGARRSSPLPPAVAALDEAVEMARAPGSPSMLGWMLLARSLTATAEGDVEAALTAADECVDALRGPTHSLSSAWAGFAHAAALLPASDPTRAADVLTAAGGGPALPLLPAPLRPAGLELLTRCWLAVDCPSDAAAAAGAADARARKRGAAPPRRRAA
jgi:hypothetical protein